MVILGFLNHFSFVEGKDNVCVAAKKVMIMTYEDHGAVRFSSEEGLHRFANKFRCLLIEVVGYFIKYVKVEVANQCEGECQALELTTR